METAMFRATRLLALTVALLAGVATASGAVVNVEFNDPADPASFSGNAGAASDPLGTHYWNLQVCVGYSCGSPSK